MKTSEVGINLIKSFESCELTAYKDPVGIWTIGWGHTQGVVPGANCTQEQADLWLMADIALAEQGVTDNVVVKLNQNQFDALVCWTFNLGNHNLNISMMLRMLNRGDFAGAAKQMVRWDHGGPEKKVIEGLTTRRKAEAALFQESLCGNESR